MSHILLIEPDAVLARTYQRAFERTGLRVTRVAHAQAAIDAAEMETPILIVLELQLAGHSGVEFLYEFRSYPDWLGVPVVVHTMVPPNEFPDEALRELSISKYHYKPNTRITQLLATVHEYMAAEQ